jgi:hypothetical protein
MVTVAPWKWVVKATAAVRNAFVVPKGVAMQPEHLAEAGSQLGRRMSASAR